MKNYRLIKEYPNSEPMGTEFIYDETWRSYRVGLGGPGTRYSTNWIASYFDKWVGEYFEVI